MPEEVAKKKPIVKLTGTDGNVFALLGLCTGALRRAGQPDEAKALATAVMSSASYSEALQHMCKFCDVR